MMRKEGQESALGDLNDDKNEDNGRNLIKKVYISLCCVFVAHGVGSYLQIQLNIGGVLTNFAALGCIYRLLAYPRREVRERVFLLMVSSLLYGASMGWLIDSAKDFGLSILASAFIRAACAFVFLSGVAMLAGCREYLYLGGRLCYGAPILLSSNFASFFFGGATLVQVKLFLGLLLFVGSMLVDTQWIIQKESEGDGDYLKHALVLFLNFVAAFDNFVFIVLLALKEQMKWKEMRNRNRRDISCAFSQLQL